MVYLHEKYLHLIEAVPISVVETVTITADLFPNNVVFNSASAAKRRFSFGCASVLVIGFDQLVVLGVSEVNDAIVVTVAAERCKENVIFFWYRSRESNKNKKIAIEQSEI
jgi:ribosomal protein L21